MGGRVHPGLADKAEGSIVIAADSTPAGSSLIGVDPVPADPNADPYFHTRPSASAQNVLDPADTSISAGSSSATRRELPLPSTRTTPATRRPERVGAPTLPNTLTRVKIEPCLNKSSRASGSAPPRLAPARR
ncbi:potassium-transporting ATPase subunit C [Pseudonocardia lacus]|uniref:potassium-transporting ATPase subunit C n=1 Tax=Pseudonocardia lacus TaxID=2835865 RepID=UPI0027E39B81|nr:potassium-transporting ATPase subunit C [Pseudonocardia lacus]